MIQRKKLQVFVSSTFTDLRNERQAAVEAILSSGHIPAGMELFAAGDQSQMAVIRRWIDESDVYLLILGGRYGSVETSTNKSYIELEYEYAAGKGIPLFSLVISDLALKRKIKKLGQDAFEDKNPMLLRAFRDHVCTKIVRFWEDTKDIKLFVHEALSDFSRRDDLSGWIPAREAFDASEVADQIARLTKENAELRAQVQRLGASGAFNGLTFDEMYRLVLTVPLPWHEVPAEKMNEVKELASLFGDSEVGLLHIFWILSDALKKGAPLDDDNEFNAAVSQALKDYSLVARDPSQSTRHGQDIYVLTAEGKQFLWRLRLKPNADDAQRFVRPYDD